MKQDSPEQTLARDVGRVLHRWLVPSEKNHYHPHVFTRRAVALLLALMVGVEGFLVASVAAQESGAGLLASVPMALSDIGAHLFR